MTNLLFKFQPLNESDLPILADWLNRKHLQEWWRSGEITLDKVREKYLPRIFEKDAARPFIAYLDGKPFGYIQYYWASEGDPNWWPDKPAPGVIGIDQFIADESQLDKGFGTAMIWQFIRFLLTELDISEVRVDPHPDNLRAIRCYENVGFRKAGQFQTPDGPAVMMVLKKDFLPNDKRK